MTEEEIIIDILGRETMTAADLFHDMRDYGISRARADRALQRMVDNRAVQMGVDLKLEVL